MSRVVVLLLAGFWALGLLNRYSFGGLIHILLVYAGLIVIARLNNTTTFLPVPIDLFTPFLKGALKPEPSNWL